MKSIRISNKSVLLFFVFIQISIGLAIWVMNEKKYFNVTDIQIQIINFPKEKKIYEEWILELNQQLDVYKNQSLWKLDMNELYSNIIRQNWISEAQVLRRWPNGIQVQIKADEIVYIYQNLKGETIPLFNNNKVTKAIMYLPEVPLLKSENLIQNFALRKKAIDFIKSIPEEGPLSRNNISEVHYDARDGFWLVLMDAGVKVHLGEDRMALKVDRVSKVLTYLKVHEFEAEMLDANFLKKVLVRRK